ncbi:MAG: hypothetical protein AUI12_05105 [Acidobacteria bacterium 13_2_20CM_2_57_6]|nr:MAG: hypothetical protein AUI12_05105 [Acidobacteria bacterium 13_2_20CM_2_57_6]
MASSSAHNQEWLCHQTEEGKVKLPNAQPAYAAAGTLKPIPKRLPGGNRNANGAKTARKGTTYVGPKGPTPRLNFDAPTVLAALRKLPKEGEEAVASAEAVVGIAGEVATEHFFFFEEAEDDQRDDEEKARQRPPGAKRRSQEEQHENSAKIHGMADEPVRSCGDDSLPLFDLYGA